MGDHVTFVILFTRKIRFSEQLLVSIDLVLPDAECVDTCELCVTVC